MFQKKEIQESLIENKTATKKEDSFDNIDNISLLEAEKIYRQGRISIKDLIAPSAMKVESSFLRLGDQYLSTIYIIAYPRYIGVGWFASVINYSIPLDVAIYYYPVASEKILKKLRNKVGNLEAQLMADSEKGAPRDPTRQTALSDIENLRDSLTQGTEKFFQTGFYITVYADNKESLTKRVETIENIFGSKLIFTKRSLFTTKQGFNSTLPLGNDELYIVNNMNSSPASASFPFISSELTSNDGILYGINRHNNSLILFDRFSLQNANAVVFATSGAGKSYAIKLEVLRSLMMGTDVVIIDPEKEYEHLSEAVGGTYINLSLNSDSKVNPFDLPKGLTKDMKSADIIRSAIITLKGLIRLMVGKLSHLEDSIVDRALLETYARKDITADSDLDNIDPPLMSDFEEVLNGMEGGEDLSQRVKKYTQGTFSGLFNSPTNVNTTNQLVVFSVRDLEDELRPIAIYTIITYIWNLVRSQVKKRILVIDEAWWLMQHEDSAKFIYALVKRCRKYYLGVTTITQDVNDFLNSPYGQAIVTNSSLQLLLKQSPASIDVIQKTFMLTEEEKYLLLQGKVGQGIFFAGNKHVAIQVEASYTEDQLITSDPRQLLEIEDAKREFNEENKK
ncbi:MAG: ATP-binding protein [Patescibacteria group bacterium]|nr:ATP-binding protein [Patescibacteria group bacterium]MDD4304770.1 ATP-binding protein [Patescibacteria group bacterium]MDD4695491.1 ATP-binding protein [Patescibacteria group bacterium]